MAMEARPETLVVLVDRATGDAQTMPPVAGRLIQAALQALSEEMDRDPMAIDMLIARGAGHLQPGPSTQQ